jgi:phage terminase small subunit
VPKPKRLTNRERALFKNLSKGMTITDAALQSGYSKKYPGQCGSQALENLRLKAPELLAKHGLDDSTLIEKYLKPALEANETEFAKFEGKITDSREVIAWGPRLQALDMTAKIRGLYVQPAEQASISLRDVTFNVIYEKRDKPKTIDASIHDSSS